MFKQLKAATVVGAMALAFVASGSAFSQSAIPRSSSEVGPMFWTEIMHRSMDMNKDGMVSRAEFLEYMGKQFDMMDAKKKGMLSKTDFMDKKMMAQTFLPAQSKE